MKSKERAQIILDEALSSFGLSKKMKTNPEIVRSIIDSMRFDDLKTEFTPMNKFLKEITVKPVSLQPMFSNIEKGIITKHPAIVDFLELALQKKWLNKSEHIIKAIHTTFVLEAITAAMSNNHKFFVEVQEHYRSKQRMHGLDSMNITKTFLRSFFISHNLFNIVKAFSLDPLMVYLRIQGGLTNTHISNDDLNKLYKDGEINYIERKLLESSCKDGSKHINKLVGINIYEAGIKDYEEGFMKNAMIAHELSEDIKRNPPKATFKNKNVIPENNTDIFYETILEKENMFPDITYSQEWASLYTTWNMAFVLGNINNLDIIFPKLLIPSLINAESSNFLGTRVISLWLSINHALFRTYDKKNKKLLEPNNKKEMAKAWGEINKKYASSLETIKICDDLKVLEENYKCFFEKKYRSFFRLVRDLFST